MTANGDQTTAESLNLLSQISELTRIPPWIERLASRFAISAATQFAMNLCLEEVLANIIHHGYAGQPNRPIDILFSNPRDGYFVLTVEDRAAPFNTVDSPELPAMNGHGESPLGGQGIRLLRKFADSLEYHSTRAGNRLSMGFASTHTVTANK
jgi:serine/threonine-protein kinase RsbW